MLPSLSDVGRASPSSLLVRRAWKWHIKQSITWQWHVIERCGFRWTYLFVKYLHISFHRKLTYFPLSRNLKCGRLRYPSHEARRRVLKMITVKSLLTSSKATKSFTPRFWWRRNCWLAVMVMAKFWKRTYFCLPTVEMHLTSQFTLTFRRAISTAFDIHPVYQRRPLPQFLFILGTARLNRSTFQSVK